MTILAAVDDEDGSRAVVRHGHDLAQAFNEELVVLHVLPETEDRKTAQTVAQRLVEEVLDDETDISAVGRLGDPEARILREAQDSSAHYIVLGSRKQTPVGKALFGSVTQIVLLNTDRPVVTVSADE
jgi:nucleotide-binding universal stress UspA family protein